MKYQYSYNGKVLVKASTNANYKFACVNKETLNKLQISSTLKGADAERSRRLSAAREGISNMTNAINAIDNGRPVYRRIEGRRAFGHRVDHDKAFYEEWLATFEAREAHWANDFMIVAVDMKEV